ERGRRGGVTLEVPVGGVVCLPDAIQVGMAGNSIRACGWRPSTTLHPTAPSPRGGGPGLRRRCRAPLASGLLCRYRQRCGPFQCERDECVPETVTHVHVSPLYRFNAKAMYCPGVPLDPPRPPAGDGPSKRAANIPGLAATG